MEREELIRTVTAAQNGDSEALNTLFNAFYNDVYYFALKTVKDDDLACDITQETFVEIINTLGDLQEPVAFVAWMKKITYHQCTRYFKKKKDVLVDEDEDGNTVFDTLAEERAEVIPDEALDKEDFRKTIMGMIDKLSDEQRAAVMMYYFDELTVKQIAEMQGVSEGTVKSRLNYARKAIKGSVEEYEKKNNIKLHSFAFLPLLLWLFRGYFAETMSAASAQTVAAGVSSATGITVSVSAGTATAAAVTTTAAATGIGAKIASIPVVAKITAGIVAATIVVGGGLAIADIATPENETTNPPAIETTLSSEFDGNSQTDEANMTDNVIEESSTSYDEDANAPVFNGNLRYDGYYYGLTSDSEDYEFYMYIKFYPDGTVTEFWKNWTDWNDIGFTDENDAHTLLSKEYVATYGKNGFTGTGYYECSNGKQIEGILYVETCPERFDSSAMGYISGTASEDGIQLDWCYQVDENGKPHYRQIAFTFVPDK